MLWLWFCMLSVRIERVPVSALVLLVICVSYSYAQTGYIDVVFLKNGGKVSGIIVEQIPNVSIKIETKDGGLLIFKMKS